MSIICQTLSFLLAPLLKFNAYVLKRVKNSYYNFHFGDFLIKLYSDNLTAAKTRLDRMLSLVRLQSLFPIGCPSSHPTSVRAQDLHRGKLPSLFARQLYNILFILAINLSAESDSPPKLTSFYTHLFYLVYRNCGKNSQLLHNSSCFAMTVVK